MTQVSPNEGRTLGTMDWLSRDGQIDWLRAVIDSCSVGAVFGGCLLGKSDIPPNYFGFRQAIFGL